MQMRRTRRTVDPSGINNLGRRSLRFTGALLMSASGTKRTSADQGGRAVPDQRGHSQPLSNRVAKPTDFRLSRSRLFHKAKGLS
jgi:hypothetical protein